MSDQYLYPHHHRRQGEKDIINHHYAKANHYSPSQVEEERLKTPESKNIRKSQSSSGLNTKNFYTAESYRERHKR